MELQIYYSLSNKLLCMELCIYNSNLLLTAKEGDGSYTYK